MLGLHVHLNLLCGENDAPISASVWRTLWNSFKFRKWNLRDTVLKSLSISRYSYFSKKEMDMVFVSCGCWNRVVSNKKDLSLLNSGGCMSKVKLLAGPHWAPGASLLGSKGESVSCLLLASGVPGKSSVFLGLQLRNFRLCPHHHMAFSCLCFLLHL